MRACALTAANGADGATGRARCPVRSAAPSRARRTAAAVTNLIPRARSSLVAALVPVGGASSPEQVRSTGASQRCPETPLTRDVRRLLGMIAERLAQHHHAVGQGLVGDDFVGPYRLEQVVAPHRARVAAHQRDEQLERARRKDDALAVSGHGCTRDIDQEIANAVQLRRAGRGHEAPRLSPRTRSSLCPRVSRRATQNGLGCRGMRRAMIPPKPSLGSRTSSSARCARAATSRQGRYSSARTSQPIHQRSPDCQAGIDEVGEARGPGEEQRRRLVAHDEQRQRTRARTRGARSGSGAGRPRPRPWPRPPARCAARPDEGQARRREPHADAHRRRVAAQRARASEREQRSR